MSSFLHKKEFKNYFRFIIRKFQISEALFTLLKFVHTRLLRCKIPDGYKGIKINNSLAHQLDSENLQTILPISLILQNENIEEELELHLAGKTLSLELENIWQYDFEDIEDEFSLHRFGWLICLMSEKVCEENLKKFESIIIDWIAINSQDITGKGWDSYSISERMVNWIYFLIIARKHTLSGENNYNKILDSLLFQIKVLLNNLEFRFSGTNNHLINNGRALYLSGAYLKHDAAMSTGRDIILSCSRNMFTPSGFLNEGSSHYQILMARTFFEIYLCAHHIEDYQFVESIEKITKKIIRGATYFSDVDPFPAFGDISPDFFPDFHLNWLRTLFSVSVNKTQISFTGKQSWYQLFRNDTLQRVKKIVPEPNEFGNSIVTFCDAGHYKISNGDYILFLYENPMGYVPEWSHGHSDIGSFVLYWKQNPIFIDTGRYNFTKTVLGLYGRSVRSHNSISIDGYEPCVTHGLNGYAQLISKRYIGSPPEITLEHENDIIVLKVKYHGFKRIWQEVEVCRIFYCHKDRIEIEDRITGSNVRSIETFFHLYPQIDILESHKENVTFSMPGNVKLLLTSENSESSELNVIKGYEGKQPAGWYFPRYGVKTPTNTLIFSNRTALPFKNRYVLKEI